MDFSRRLYFLAILFAGLFLWRYPAGGQTFRGGINGVVTDQAGAAIAGAQVTATADDTQVSHATVSSSAGEFVFQDLPLGSYTVTASASGFETLKVGKVMVTAGTLYTLPMKLTVASQATTVEVSAAAADAGHDVHDTDDGLTGESSAGHSAEWPRLHAAHRTDAGLCRICGRRIWFAEWHTRQPDELAD
ncbi:MAG: carboxypeptidase-like regulatory domain-containing protein [Bacillota bacterium]|nr:carboxypeptidase-like regulatory domain-containing protein [Bacillota bacterium]